MTDICAFLSGHGIAFERFDHAAVFTVEESSQLPPMPGAGTKNLFLRDEKGTRLFLVVVSHEKRVDLKQLRAVLGVGKLSFGSPESLKQHLGVDPGSVTVLGLVHDEAHAVEAVIDRELWDAASVQCHPLVNTATLVIPHQGLVTFLAATGHVPRIVDVPARA